MILKITPLLKSDRKFSLKVSYCGNEHFINSRNQSCEIEYVQGKNTLHIEQLNSPISSADFFGMLLKNIENSLSSRQRDWRESCPPILSSFDVTIPEDCECLDLIFRQGKCSINKTDHTFALPALIAGDDSKIVITQKKLTTNKQNIFGLSKLFTLSFSLITAITVSALAALIVLMYTRSADFSSKQLLMIVSAVLAFLLIGTCLWSVFYHRRARNKLIAQAEDFCKRQNNP